MNNVTEQNGSKLHVQESICQVSSPSATKLSQTFHSDKRRAMNFAMMPFEVDTTEYIDVLRFWRAEYQFFAESISVWFVFSLHYRDDEKELQS